MEISLFNQDRDIIEIDRTEKSKEQKRKEKIEKVYEELGINTNTFSKIPKGIFEEKYLEAEILKIHATMYEKIQASTELSDEQKQEESKKIETYISVVMVNEKEKRGFSEKDKDIKRLASDYLTEKTKEKPKDPTQLEKEEGLIKYLIKTAKIKIPEDKDINELVKIKNRKELEIILEDHWDKIRHIIEDPKNKQQTFGSWTLGALKHLSEIADTGLSEYRTEICNKILDKLNPKYKFRIKTIESPKSDKCAKRWQSVIKEGKFLKTVKSVLTKVKDLGSNMYQKYQESDLKSRLDERDKKWFESMAKAEEAKENKNPRKK